MAKRNGAGKTWKQHSGTFLSKALKQASRTWKPKAKRTNMAKVSKLRTQRLKINAQIKAEIEKG